MNILEVKNVSKAYSGHLALDNVSLDVPKGTVYGLLGPNGAGKTTLIRIINHITAPDSGQVFFDGHPMVQGDTAQIGYLPEERGLYKKMKVGDQAVFFARLKGLSHSEAVRQLKMWFERFEISSWWDKKVDELSKGMAQKVQFIVTVLHHPKLLIFDEPFSGFDPVNANMLKDEILKLRDLGATIIFSTHNMSSVEEICDHITLIDHSKNVLTGRVDELRHQFADGRYDIHFIGDGELLSSRLLPMIDEKNLIIRPDAPAQLSFHLSNGATLRDIISKANDIVEIRAVNESVTSMNDIFIRTVRDNSATN